MYYFCTYFDKNYLLRGLNLFTSLSRQQSSFKLFVLCLDNEVYRTLTALKLENLQVISLQEVESYFPLLEQAKGNRSLIEYYFTLTPFLPLFILKKYSIVDIITYLDADLFFYADPRNIFEIFEGYDILIVPHRFPPHLRHLEDRGKFNVQLISFRNNANGLACLEYYKERCFEWCYDRVEGERFADQKYLDAWPSMFPNVLVLEHKGAGLAPWNWMQYNLSYDKQSGKLTVDNDELVFFHFHGLKIINRWLINFNQADFGAVMPQYLRLFFYGNYMKEFLANKSKYLDSLDDVNFFSEIRFKETMLRYIYLGLVKGDLMFCS